jgi:hypothetical protein
MEKALGRSVKASEAITALLIDGASSHGMLVLFHADLRKYGEFVEEMVRSHPKINFNIPHFGSSRKLMSVRMDRYSNRYTDFFSRHLCRGIRQLPKLPWRTTRIGFFGSDGSSTNQRASSLH